MWQGRLPRPEEAEFVALDTETTGLLPASAKLVEIGAVRFRADGSVVAEYQQLVNPGEPIPASARLVHGITDEMVAGAPPVSEILPEFLSFIAGDSVVLAAHNAPFDLAFLAIALARAGMDLPDIPVVDTRLLARLLLPRLRRYSLDAVAEKLGIEVRERHRALPDAHAVRLVVVELLEWLEPGQFERLPELMEVITFRDVDIAPAEVPAELAEIGAAMEEGLDVEIVYGGGSRPGQARRVTPLAVYRQGGRVYLAAFCHRDQVEKTFRMDKIAAVRIVTEGGG